ncbi:hypothetical protein HDU91_005920 [Kappamyces sp. JEL0680]|nr:hypothetical protein HDU91_005920 [Kappamyces sp. JEL0680]
MSSVFNGPGLLQTYYSDAACSLPNTVYYNNPAADVSSVGCPGIPSQSCSPIGSSFYTFHCVYQGPNDTAVAAFGSTSYVVVGEYIDGNCTVPYNVDYFIPNTGACLMNYVVVDFNPASGINVTHYDPSVSDCKGKAMATVPYAAADFGKCISTGDRTPAGQPKWQYVDAVNFNASASSNSSGSTATSVSTASTSTSASSVTVSPLSTSKPAASSSSSTGQSASTGAQFSNNALASSGTTLGTSLMAFFLLFA